MSSATFWNLVSSCVPHQTAAAVTQESENGEKEKANTIFKSDIRRKYYHAEDEEKAQSRKKKAGNAFTTSQYRQ